MKPGNNDVSRHGRRRRPIPLVMHIRSVRVLHNPHQLFLTHHFIPRSPPLPVVAFTAHPHQTLNLSMATVDFPNHTSATTTSKYYLLRGITTSCTFLRNPRACDHEMQYVVARYSIDVTILAGPKWHASRAGVRPSGRETDVDCVRNDRCICLTVRCEFGRKHSRWCSPAQNFYEHPQNPWNAARPFRCCCSHLLRELGEGFV